jgi:hypothetical protein
LSIKRGTIIASNENRDLHAAEEILEMQKILLQKLARRENIVKGFQDGKSTNGKRMGTGEAPECSPTDGDPEEWKGEMAQALHIIWSWACQFRLR